MRERRPVLGLLLMCLPAAAWGAVCPSTGSGSWSDPSLWQNCGTGLPGATDSAVIKAGHQVTFDLPPSSGDTVYQVTVEAGATLRFAPGDRRLQLGRDDVLAVDLRGTLSVGNGTVIAFNSDSLPAGFAIGNQAEFNSAGVTLGPLREVSLFTAAGATAACGGTEQWQIETATSTAALVAGDLVQFSTGAAQGRMFEIVAVLLNQIVLCPELPDELSLGARLTGHLDSDAVLQPGTAPSQIPAAGDRFWAWHPWRVLSVGLFPWGLTENLAPAREAGGRFEWVGGDFSGFGGSGAIGIFLRCAGSRPPVEIRHNNFHDYGQGITLNGGLSSDSGCDRPNLTWNVIHDGTVPDFNYHLGVQRTRGGPVSGGVIAWNTFYRTAHNTMQVNAVGIAAPVEGFDVAYNTGFDLGITDSGECEFIETDVMAESVVQFNRAWRVSRGCGAIPAKPSAATAAFQKNLYRGNYLQGARFGIDLSTAGLLYPGNTAVSNYVTDSYRYGMRVRAAYGNAVRRWSEGNQPDSSANLYGLFSVEVEGNHLDGGGSARASQGIFVGSNGVPAQTSRIRNNVVRGLSETSGLTGCIMFSDSAEAHSVAIEHNACDCDAHPSCSGVDIRPGFRPESPVTVEVVDNVVFDLQTNPNRTGAAARSTGGSANLTDDLLNLTRWPAEAMSAAGNWASLAGEVARDPRFVHPDFDLNYRPDSEELGAGSRPPGSSIGIRYAAFDLELFPSWLQAVMVVPVPIANDSLGDADGDAIPDDIDACPSSPDPLQPDGDGDGQGDLCDPCSDVDNDGFGSPVYPDTVCPRDNCAADPNPSQADGDADGFGDECDLDDGLILVNLPEASLVTWQPEQGNDAFNEYRGVLSVLRLSGEYTQDPMADPRVVRNCAVAGSSVVDGPDPSEGEVFFYLVTGVQGGVEKTLGTDSAGAERPNLHPCS